MHFTMNTRILTVGLALFTMFFGAGNITIPLFLVQSWPHDLLSAFIGFCFSGVFVIILGLIGGVLCKNTTAFFAPLGLSIGLILQLILVLIEGPFGVVPRCFIVSFGSVKEILPSVPPVLYYVGVAVVIYFVTANKIILVEGIGKYLTTTMLSALAIIVGITIYKAGFSSVANLHTTIDKHILYDGVAKGYLTYDLPGAIYFSTIIMAYFKEIGHTNKEMIVNGLKASAICSALLMFVYAVFFYLGLSYVADIANVAPEQVLVAIVKKSGGEFFASVFVIFVVLATTTTAMAAITIWTDFICALLKRYNPKHQYILIPSLAIAVTVSTLQFTGLVKLLSPVLNIIYPILIGLTIYNIVTKLKNAKAALS